jgi:pimeloyl-ACP methyl ester carboxylesterase
VAGQGAPLLLIHGANVGWGQWALNLKHLAKYFKVIAVDLPGCGGSTPIDFNKIKFAEFAEVMGDFIRLLKAHHLSIVGHSFGGAVAIKLAGQAELDVRKLVLVGPLGFSRTLPGRQKLVTLRPIAKLLSRTAVKPTRTNIKKFLSEPLVRHDGITNEFVDYYYTAIQENKFNHPLLFMHSLTRPLLLRQELLLTSQFDRIKQPTLIIIGNKDRMMPLGALKRAAAARASVRLEILSDIGHVPPLECPDLFNKKIINFLR